MKLRSFFLLVIVFSFSLFAEKNQTISFSIQPNIGFSFNSYDEKFYSSMGKQKDVSYLKWETKPLYSIGFEAFLRIHNCMINASFDYALPVTCGNMYDSDYDSFSDLQFCYSISELKSAVCIHSNIDLAYNLAFTNSFSFLPKISLYYYYDFFEARNGYGWYGMETSKHPLVSWDDPRARYYEKGTLNGVDFYRHSLLSFIGFELNYKRSNFCIAGEVQLSPYTYFQTMDHHLSKSGGYHVLQKQSSSFTHYMLKGSVTYKINERFSPQIEINYISGSSIKGKLYSDIYSGQMELTDQKSGANLTSLSLKAGFLINII